MAKKYIAGPGINIVNFTSANIYYLVLKHMDFLITPALLPDYILFLSECLSNLEPYYSIIGPFFKCSEFKKNSIVIIK
jgi:hypothetical protein